MFVIKLLTFNLSRFPSVMKKKTGRGSRENSGRKDGGRGQEGNRLGSQEKTMVGAGVEGGRRRRGRGNGGQNIHD